MATAGANAIMVAVFGAIALIMIKEMVLGRQWFTNPILTATVAIFVTCTAGHGVHLFHALEPTFAGTAVGASLGLDADIGEATRVSFSDPLLLVWDGLTAVVAIVFWIVRSRLEYIFHGAALNEDMALRQKQAMDLHDNVVQGLARAKLALDLGRREEGERAVSETLAQAKGIISGLLGEKGKSIVLGPGDLRRELPSR